MDIEKFRKSSSGKIIKAGQGDAAYWSFNPHPLPPELAFDHELIRALSDADRSLGELAEFLGPGLYCCTLHMRTRR
jgi:hypothetical protein